MKLTNKWRMSLPSRTHSLLSWGRRFFFVIGILALGYVGLVLVDAKIYQAYQSRRFQQELKSLRPLFGSNPDRPPVSAAANRPGVESLTMADREGRALGRIEISPIGLSAMILEGTDDGTLQHAVGHITGTALPGGSGNVAIAGHRDTFFRPLRNIHKGDEIQLTTLSGTYRYRVDFTEVVEPENIGVLDDSDSAILTLVTCYPFYFLGSAPKRFIVRAHRL